MPRVDTSKHGGGAGGGGVVFLCGCGYHLRGLEGGLELEFSPLRRSHIAFWGLFLQESPVRMPPGAGGCVCLLLWGEVEAAVGVGVVIGIGVDMRVWVAVGVGVAVE